jgi:threonine dehydrogenase-like Zn-dependent dehydrogenase
VLGAGSVGLLATMALRARELEVTTLSLEEAPSIHSQLVEAVGARYISTRRQALSDAARQHGPFDLIFEATGYSPLVFEAMDVLGRNGVLVLSSVTEGSRKVDVPADAINLSFVLGNKAMIGTVNAAREHFEAGVHDMAYIEALYPDWLARLITDRVTGLEQFPSALQLLEGGKETIKVVVEIASI